MDLTRRLFLQLAGGLSGASALSLFSAVPTVGAGEDFVFEPGTKPYLKPDSQAYFLLKDEQESLGYVILRNPQAYRALPWHPVGDLLEYRVDMPALSEEGADPLVEFFLAAESLRGHIRSDTENVAREVAALHMGDLDVVTQVHTPVVAFPHPEKGVYLGCAVSRFLVDRGGVWNPEVVVSTRGEVPVVPPGNVELQLLLLAQEELRARGLLLKQDTLNLVLRQLRYRRAANGRA
jgi:hypothetical protein